MNVVISVGPQDEVSTREYRVSSDSLTGTGTLVIKAQRGNVISLQLGDYSQHDGQLIAIYDRFIAGLTELRAAAASRVAEREELEAWRASRAARSEAEKAVDRAFEDGLDATAPQEPEAVAS